MVVLGIGWRHMGEFVSPAILDEQMSSNEIRQTGTVFQPIMSKDGPAWGKLGPCKEISDLFEGCAVLQGNAHQTGDDVVETDDLRSAVSPFHPKEEFGWGWIVVDGKIQRASANADLLGDVVATRREGKALAHTRCPPSTCAQIVPKPSSGEGYNRLKNELAAL